jgi:hypothetical protein
MTRTHSQHQMIWTCNLSMSDVNLSLLLRANAIAAVSARAAASSHIAPSPARASAHVSAIDGPLDASPTRRVHFTTSDNLNVDAPHADLISAPRRTRGTSLVKPRQAEAYTEDEARAASRRLRAGDIRHPSARGNLDTIRVRARTHVSLPSAPAQSDAIADAADIVLPHGVLPHIPAHTSMARVPLRPAQRSFANYTPVRVRVANKLAGFRPPEPFTAEELMLLHEVVPSDFAAQFSAFINELRETPRMLTPTAIQNITNSYDLLRVCSVQRADSAVDAGGVVHWDMRYVTMPRFLGSCINIQSTFVVDTGAIVNCMSVAYYAAYKDILHLQGVRAVQPVRDAAADIVSVEETALTLQTVLLDVPFAIGNRRFSSHFLLIDGLQRTPFMMGGPWLRTTKCDVQYSSSTISFGATDKLPACVVKFDLTEEKLPRVGSLIL